MFVEDKNGIWQFNSSTGCASEQDLAYAALLVSIGADVKCLILQVTVASGMLAAGSELPRFAKSPYNCTHYYHYY